MTNAELLPALQFTPPVLSMNFEELESKVREITDTYTGLIVQEEDVPSIKNEMAGLNKLAAQLADARKDAVSRVSGPIRDFEERVKGLEIMIKDTRSLLDEQVKAHIERERDSRRASVQLVIDVHKSEHGCKDLEIPIQESWLNKTAKDRVISDSILAIILDYKRQVEAAANLEQAKKDRVVALENHNAAMAQAHGYALSFSRFAHLQGLDISLPEALNALSDIYSAEEERLAEMERMKAEPVAPAPEPHFTDPPKRETPAAVEVQRVQKAMNICATYSAENGSAIQALYRQIKALCLTCTVSIKEL